MGNRDGGEHALRYRRILVCSCIRGSTIPRVGEGRSRLLCLHYQLLTFRRWKETEKGGEGKDGSIPLQEARMFNRPISWNVDELSYSALVWLMSGGRCTSISFSLIFPCMALVLVSDDRLSYRCRLSTHSPAGVLLTSQSYPRYKNSARIPNT